MVTSSETHKQIKGVTVPSFRLDSVLVALTCPMTDVSGHLLKLIILFGWEPNMEHVFF